MLKQTQPEIFFNGKKSSVDHLVKPVLENSITVFESLKSCGGKLFQLDEHLNRLVESAKTIGLKLPKTRAELKKELRSVTASESGRDRFIHLMVDERNSFIFILDRVRPASIYKEGLSLVAVPTRRNLANAEPPEVKTSAFLNVVLAQMEAECRGGAEPILLDGNGYLTEAQSWNVFLVKNGAVLTPAIGMLRGVTRAFVIKCAEAEHLPVIESNLTRHDAWNADEAFLTNTSGEIAPARSLDGRVIGKEIPGPATKRLMARFRKSVIPECFNRESIERGFPLSPRQPRGAVRPSARPALDQTARE